PVEVASGPVLENVRRGADVDMTIFPAPRWHPGDGGRYIGTGSFGNPPGPRGGGGGPWTHPGAGAHPPGPGDSTPPGKQRRLHRQKYFDRGEPCPVAMVFGSDPLLFLASCTEIPYGVSEYEWVGAVRREPLQVIRGPVTGLPIPADAEIAVEGYASATEMLP